MNKYQYLILFIHLIYNGTSAGSGDVTKPSFIGSFAHPFAKKDFKLSQHFWDMDYKTKFEVKNLKSERKDRKEIDTFICNSFLFSCIFKGKPMLSALALVTPWLFSYSTLRPILPSPCEVLLSPFKVYLLPAPHHRLSASSPQLQVPSLPIKIPSIVTTWLFCIKAGFITPLLEKQSPVFSRWFCLTQSLRV